MVFCIKLAGSTFLVNSHAKRMGICFVLSFFRVFVCSFPFLISLAFLNFILMHRGIGLLSLKNIDVAANQLEQFIRCGLPFE